MARTIVLDDLAITERFVRAAGPGGQNVNKVATAKRRSAIKRTRSRRDED